MLGFHHHIQQDDGHIAEGGKQLAGFGFGVSVDKFQWPVQDGGLLQREAGGTVDIFIVVHNCDFPRR
jgi:hypothetical protein